MTTEHFWTIIISSVMWYWIWYFILMRTNGGDKVRSRKGAVLSQLIVGALLMFILILYKSCNQ
jgi:hypothetical protein